MMKPVKNKHMNQIMKNAFLIYRYLNRGKEICIKLIVACHSITMDRVYLYHVVKALLQIEWTTMP